MGIVDPPQRNYENILNRLCGKIIFDCNQKIVILKQIYKGNTFLLDILNSKEQHKEV